MKKRGCLFRLFQVFVLLIVLIAAFIYFYFVFPFWGIPFNAQRHTNVPITPPWALECWLWEDDENTAAAVMDLLDGYAKHDFPVRTILIDSPWSTRYNDFVVDENRYPNPAEFFKTLHDRGYRVVLWMTCMVNSFSKDTAIQDSTDWYEEAARKGYLAGGGSQWKWWKGKGGFIDYTNPEAMNWWRGMQQQVFDWGLDGWKLDGTDTLFFGRLGPIPVFPYMRVHKGIMTTRGYMDHYARDEYRYGLTKNPEFITLIRSVDKPLSHPEGFTPLDAAPVTWVGDKDHTWKTKTGKKDDVGALDKAFSFTDEGIEGALRDILLAAKKGYSVVGCDIPGYLGGEIPPRLYIRWAQFGCFTGLFLNGGHGERRLWKRTNDELEIIRKFSWLHTELVPYMYSHVVVCHEGGKPLMRPVDGEFHYLFGDDFLVAPIYEDELTNQVTLPKGRWRYLFDDKEVIEGPKTFSREFPLDEFSVYVRDGAIIPMNVSRAYTGFGDADSTGFLTLNIYPNGTNEFTIHQTDNSGTTTVRVSDEKDLTISLDGVKKPHILRVLMPKKPTGITLDGTPLAEGTDWRYDEANQRLWVKTKDYAAAKYVIVEAR